MHLAQDRNQWWTLCEHSDETFGSIKGGKFVNWLSDY